MWRCRPILRERDTRSWLTETIPDDLLERVRLRENRMPWVASSEANEEHAAGEGASTARSIAITYGIGLSRGSGERASSHQSGSRAIAGSY